ncbi:MAG: alpha-mannosidase, partial [Anaerolineae bacterium]|nr:alpha-mannosidase [Anaerolineae bacterium]
MPYQATLVSHTHWDRAWYCTFQEYRVRLVRLVDRLLDILNKDPHYRAFMLDGQMSVLEDYLEIRPHNAETLQALCRSGRLQVGPWFVLADEFLVSPEALIRNMKLGHEMGKAYGGVAKIGYVPDGFG